MTAPTDEQIVDDFFALSPDKQREALLVFLDFVWSDDVSSDLAFAIGEVQ